VTKYIVYGLALAASALALAGCHSAGDVDVEPVVRTVEVKVPVAVPCKALGQLGAEPVYPDSAGALQTAVDIFEQVKLLLAGRKMRIQRLDEYVAARTACQ